MATFRLRSFVDRLVQSMIPPARPVQTAVPSTHTDEVDDLSPVEISASTDERPDTTPRSTTSQRSDSLMPASSKVCKPNTRDEAEWQEEMDRQRDREEQQEARRDQQLVSAAAAQVQLSTFWHVALDGVESTTVTRRDLVCDVDLKTGEAAMYLPHDTVVEPSRVRVDLISEEYEWIRELAGSRRVREHAKLYNRFRRMLYDSATESDVIQRLEEFRRNGGMRVSTRDVTHGSDMGRMEFLWGDKPDNEKRFADSVDLFRTLRARARLSPDQGLEVVGGEVRRAELYGPNITDDLLAPLFSNFADGVCPALEHVHLVSTRVSAQCLNRLRQAMPQVKVECSNI